MKRFIAAVVFLLVSAGVLAQEAPDALVRNVTNSVLAVIKQDKELQSGNMRRAVELVESKVLPHFNFQRMTSLAVGREWNKASTQQKEQLINEFRTLLVRTYSNALTQYREQVIEFKPFSMQAGETDVTVRTQVNQPGAKPIQLDYMLEKQGNGWKVYDVSVAGISLVTNYRSTFGDEIRNNGMDGLIKALVTKNAKTSLDKKL